MKHLPRRLCRLPNLELPRTAPMLHILLYCSSSVECNDPLMIMIIILPSVADIRSIHKNFFPDGHTYAMQKIIPAHVS